MSKGKQILAAIKIKSEQIGVVEEVHNGRRYFSDEWKVVLKYKGKQMTVSSYAQGSGWNGAEPKIKDVMACLLSDARAYNEASGIEEFADNFSYDLYEEKKRTEKVWNACKKEAAQIERVFSPEETQALMSKLHDY